MNKSKRIFYFDVLRAIAIIGIVFCHAAIFFLITGVNSSYFPVTAFFDCLRDFSIPIFLMLSGALLLNRDDSLIKFFKKRLSRLLIPFLFWVLVYVAYASVYIWHGFNIKSSIDILLGTSGTLGVTFWFIWMIIICYLGIFAINKVIKFGNERKENFDSIFIKILTGLSLIYILISEFGLFNPYFSRLVYFVSFISYIVIGYFIANNDYVGRKIDSKIIIAVTLVVSIILYSYYIFGFVVPQSTSSNHFVYKGYFNLLILVLSVNIFIFFKYLSKTKFLTNIESNNVGNAITVFSNYSFGLYLCHYLIIYHLKINYTKFFLDQNFLISIPLLVIIVIVISLVILWILDKIPYLNRFSGKS